MRDTRAIILAGGRGTRLAPFTINFPKPLVPIGDVPVIELILRRLIRAGITDVTLCLGHLAELFRAYFAQHRSLGSHLNLSFVEEELPLGTAGSLRLVEGLGDTFIVMNGDVMTDLNLQQLLRYHRQCEATLTIATHARRTKLDLGVVELDAHGRVTDYVEKPEYAHQVSMGVYVYEPSVLRYIEADRYLDFPTLVLRLLEAGEPVVAYRSADLWLDIGQVEDYAKAQELYAQRQEEFELV